MDGRVTSYIWHITLNTGHSRRSERSEVDDGVISTVRLILAEAVAAPGQRIPVIPGPPDIALEAHPAGPHLLAPVWDSHTGAPLLTLGIAPRSREAGRLWEVLHGGNHHLVVGLADVPRAPWCGFVLHPTIMLRPDAMRWAGDMERCVAWAWMELRRDLGK